jgi:hypothetical protein
MTDHLILAELIAYGDPGCDDSRRGEIATHMTECERCRKTFASLMTFKNALGAVPETFPVYEMSPQCIPIETMGDFLGRRLPPSEQSYLALHIVECDGCFERAAYSARETVKMAEGALFTPPTPQRFLDAVIHNGTQTAPSPATQPGIGWIDALGRLFTSPVPAYAFAAILLIFLTFKPGGPDGLTPLTTDSSFTLYQQPEHVGPSFGFSDAGKKIGEQPADLNVHIDGEQLQFDWTAVEGASGYAFSLVELASSGPVEIYESKVENPVVTLPRDLIKNSVAYQWKIQGATANATLFTANAQFTLLDREE